MVIIIIILDSFIQQQLPCSMSNINHQNSQPIIISNPPLETITRNFTKKGIKPTLSSSISRNPNSQLYPSPPSTTSSPNNYASSYAFPPNPKPTNIRLAWQPPKLHWRLLDLMPSTWASPTFTDSSISYLWPIANPTPKFADYAAV